MKSQSNRCNGLVHEPPCTSWPPLWLAEWVHPPPSTPSRTSAKPILPEPPPEPPPDSSPWELSPELYERWEERVCIMHYDGRVPWREAEQMALAEILHESEPLTDNVSSGTASNAVQIQEIDKVKKPARASQSSLFATANDPYL